MLKSATKISLAGALLGSGMGIGFVAEAQERPESLFARDRNIGVMDRPRPEYTSDGIQRGAFIFTPALNLGLEYTDNVFGTSQNEESDVAAIINPSIGATTTWSRHALTGDASITRREYADFNDESVWNWTLGGAGRLDVRRDTSLEAGARYSALTEARTSAGAANQAAEPIEYDSFNAFLGARRAVGRFLAQGELGLDEIDYDDALLFGGGIADQDFRDHTQTKATARADYAVSPDTAVFGRIRLNEREYDLAPPNVTTLRDSSGYTFDVGADFDIRGVATGVFGIGYTEQDYDFAGLPDVDGLSLDGLIRWFPTQLTTITLSAARDIKDAPFANSGGFFATSAGVSIDHELRRNVILSAGFSLSEDDYSDIDRTDERYGLNAGVTYFMNRNVGVRGSWNYQNQDSSGAAGNQDFSRNTFGVSLVLRP
jgi:hypothetical protein